MDRFKQMLGGEQKVVEEGKSGAGITFSYDDENGNLVMQSGTFWRDRNSLAEILQKNGIKMTGGKFTIPPAKVGKVIQAIFDTPTKEEE